MLLARIVGRLANIVNNIKLSYVGDAFFALFSRLAPKVASTLLFIVLMRQAGASVAGAYSLSIAFLTSGVLFSSIGLDELIVREVARDPSRSRRYLVNMLFLRGLLSLAGYGVVVGVVTLVFDYTVEVRHIILLQCLGILPESLNATMFAVFNANRRLNWMAFVSVCVGVFQLSVGGAALWMGADLESLIWILLCSSLLGVAISAYLSKKLLAIQSVPSTSSDNAWKHSTCWQPDWAFCRQQLKLTLPFALIISLVSLDLQLDVILLSALCDVAEVGIYSAARTVILLFSLLPQAFRMVIYPSMSRACATSETKLRRVYSQSWWYLALIGLPLTIGGMITSHRIVDLVYGNVPVTIDWSLAILMLYLLVGFLYLPGTRLMVVSDHQMWLSLLLGLSLGVNLLTNVLLVPRLGSVGAAIARDVSSLLYFLFVELYISLYVLPRHGGFRMALKPLLATVVMAAVIWPLREQALYVTIPLGVLSYGFVFALGSVFPPKKQTLSMDISQ